MSNLNISMVSKDTGTLQIPYGDYTAIMEKVEEGQQLNQIKESMIEYLQSYTLKGNADLEAVLAKVDAARTPASTPKAAPAPKATPAQPVSEPEPVVEQPKPVEVAKEAPVPAPATAPTPSKNKDGVEIPPIKKDISVHFNKLDESGRLFSVFKQYYACLNDTCGGTVRVTMKDGFCSLWNYDEWEEFAFVDIFEGQLRLAVDPRYTDALQSLNLCEVPRLLSSRRSLVCVQLDDLNNIMLDVLVKAFQEVGQPAS